MKSLLASTYVKWVFFAMVAFLIPLLLAKPAYAATVTWDGEGADDNFSTAANWDGDAVPVDGDDLVFPASVDADTTTGDDRDLNNDLTNFIAASISVSGTYIADDYDYYDISGNDITVTGDILGNSENAARPDLDLAMNVTATAAITMRAIEIDGSLDIGAYDLVMESSEVSSGLTGSGQVTLTAASNNNAGGAGGAGGCNFGAVTDSYPINGDSSGFSGAIILNDNSLSVTGVANHLASNASSITVNAGTLAFRAGFGESLTINTPLTLSGGGLQASQLPETIECNDPEPVDITISQDLNITSATSVRLFDANLVLSGTTTGASNLMLEAGQATNASLTVNGTRIVSERSDSTFSGDQSSETPYLPENNRATIQSGGIVGNVTVAGGELFGVGTAGSINMSSGSVNPGLSPGCLSSGDLNYSGGTLEIEIAGTTVCTQYDQQDVTGAVDVTGASLNITFLSSFVPAVGNTFTIISNDAADVVTGTFSGLAEGASLTQDGVTFTISYAGGDGNDVVLTVTDAPEPTATPDAPDTGAPLFSSSNPLTAMIGVFAAASAVVLATRARFAAAK